MAFVSAAPFTVPPLSTRTDTVDGSAAATAPSSAWPSPIRFFTNCCTWPGSMTSTLPTGESFQKRT